MWDLPGIAIWRNLRLYRGLPYTVQLNQLSWEQAVQIDLVYLLIASFEPFISQTGHHTSSLSADPIASPSKALKVNPKDLWKCHQWSTFDWPIPTSIIEIKDGLFCKVHESNSVQVERNWLSPLLSRRLPQVLESTPSLLLRTRGVLLLRGWVRRS